MRTSDQAQPAAPRGAVGLWLSLSGSMGGVLLLAMIFVTLGLVYVQAHARLARTDRECNELLREEEELKLRQRELLAGLDAARDPVLVRRRAEEMRLVRVPDESMRRLALETGQAPASRDASKPARQVAQRWQAPVAQARGGGPLDGPLRTGL